VLKKPSREDRQSIDDAIHAALEVMPDILEGQFERAMHVLHSRSA
jgi:PTH1 family peptidyl-tRNA hydrolase